MPWVDEQGMEALSTMLGISAMQRWRFTEGDAESLRRDVGTVCKAATQKVGWSGKHCKDTPGAVSASEMDGAVVRILCFTACLVASGALDSLKGVFESGGETA